MAADLLSVVREAGGNLEYDWVRYLFTRYEPNDGPQAQIVAFLRNLFSERVLTAMMGEIDGRVRRWSLEADDL